MPGCWPSGQSLRLAKGRKGLRWAKDYRHRKEEDRKNSPFEMFGSDGRTFAKSRTNEKMFDTICQAWCAHVTVNLLTVFCT